MSVAASAGRPTRIRPVNQRVPARSKMNVMARRAMQEAALPTSAAVHRAAAVGALTHSMARAEDREPFREALLKAEVVAAIEKRKLLDSGRIEHTRYESISMAHHDLSYDFAHMMQAIYDELDAANNDGLPPPALPAGPGGRAASAPAAAAAAGARAPPAPEKRKLPTLKKLASGFRAGARVDRRVSAVHAAADAADAFSDAGAKRDGGGSDAAAAAAPASAAGHPEAKGEAPAADDHHYATHHKEPGRALHHAYHAPEEGARRKKNAALERGDGNLPREAGAKAVAAPSRRRHVGGITPASGVEDGPSLVALAKADAVTYAAQKRSV